MAKLCSILNTVEITAVSAVLIMQPVSGIFWLLIKTGFTVVVDDIQLQHGPLGACNVRVFMCYLTSKRWLRELNAPTALQHMQIDTTRAN